MDGRRFDALTRRLSIATSRRKSIAAFGIAMVPVALRRAPAEAISQEPCRWADLPCRRNKDCCQGAVCAGGRCTCHKSKIQCGDICVTEAIANSYSCCKPYKSQCDPNDWEVQCCGNSSCTGRLDGNRVCCGLHIHPCTEENKEYCCSGECGSNGRCTQF